MGDRLAYSIEVESDLLSKPLAPMLLQPLVENAIKHGLEPKIEGGLIRIAVSRQGSHMLIQVKDNGLGFRPGADAGVGLQNLRERLAVLYDARARLLIEELDPGTAVMIDIPL